ncbi:Bacteriophage lysis protein [Pragia fontium]|nr:Bacteriophage lysis protein [Pragia fontium]
MLKRSCTELATATATRQLSIKASCPATTGSVGDDSSVELSYATGQSVLDIRSGIIKDQGKIGCLQNYITKVGLSR